MRRSPVGAKSRGPATLPVRRRAVRPLLVLGLVAILFAGCDDIPQDPEGSLERILERGSMRVGVQAHPPWVTGGPGEEPGGVEAELLRQFARELGVDIEWTWGPAERHFEGLARYELDAVAAGLTAGSPWRKHVALTRGYHTSRLVVAVPPDHPPLEDLEEAAIGVRAGRGHGQPVDAHEGSPVPVSELSGFPGPVAAYEYELRRLGLMATDIVLQWDDHVLAAPPGENALLVRMDRFLAEAGSSLARERLSEGAP